MKTLYNGVNVEGTPDEIKELIGSKDINKPKRKYVFKDKRKYKSRKKFVMSEQHKNSIRKGIKKHWRNKNKGR